MLVGFVNMSGSEFPEPFHTESGMPVVFNANTYSDDPAVIEQYIRRALEAHRAGGPDVLFISASTWGNDLPGLAEVIGNLAGEEDLVFMTPSQLFTCLER